MGNLIIMLESEEHDYRYEFYLCGIKTSNVDPTICKYEIHEKVCKRLCLGSTCTDNYINNNSFIDIVNHLVCQGFVEVKERSFA